MNNHYVKLHLVEAYKDPLPIHAFMYQFLLQALQEAIFNDHK